MSSNSARYIVPGDVLLTLAISCREGFDGLIAASMAKQQDDLHGLVIALQYIHARLDTIHTTLLAIAVEQPGEAVRNGSH